MDSSIILYIVLGLISIFFIVASIFSGKTWQVLHVLIVAAVFVAAMFAMFLCAATFKTNDTFRTEYEAFKKELDQVETEIGKLREGYAQMDSGEVVRAEDSVRSLKAELSRVLYDRGRVWPNCFVDGFGQNSVTLNLSRWGDQACFQQTQFDAQAGLPEADGEAVPNDPHGIEGRMIVYAFLETPVSGIAEQQRAALLVSSKSDLAGHEEMCKVPTVYLGKFAVSEVSPTTVTLVPTKPLREQQIAAMQDEQSSWRLLETMPVDSFDIFADLDETQLQSLFAPEVIDQYLKDRKPGDRGQDPGERLWMKVRFDRDHEIAVDAPGEPPKSPQQDYNNVGQADPKWLRHGGEGEDRGKAKFTKGEEAIFDPETADDLINRGICEELDRVYVRELRDYDYLFESMHARAASLADTAETIRRDTEILIAEPDGAIAQVNKNIAYREQEINKLKADLAKFTYERDELVKYREAVEREQREVTNFLTSLYHTNLALVVELTAVSQRLEQSIDQRTREAAESAAAVP